MAGSVDMENVRAAGIAHCDGGTGPEPPIHDYPLLAWSPAQYGEGVWTEDGRASVGQIASALLELHSYEAVAERFGATPAHVAQAVDYAVKAGYPGV